MAKFHDRLTPELIQFMAAQPLFFVATAPPQGRINLSPKGLDTFRVVNDQTVCYLDLTGSGNETSAHLLADGRMTLMFCSFSEKPLILRLYGRGTVILPPDKAWPARAGLFPLLPGIRQIVEISLASIQTSCGFGVPLLNVFGERPTLTASAETKGEEALSAYRAERNRQSIDGLPTHLATR